MSSQLKREKEYNISLLHQSDIGKNRLNSEYEMFLDEDKKKYKDFFRFSFEEMCNFIAELDNETKFF